MATIRIQVTAEEMAKVHRMNGFYIVESRSQENVEYHVQKLNGCWTCTCPAGQHGFANCSEQKCWHVRAVMAHCVLHQRRMARIQKLVAMGLTQAQAITAVDTSGQINGQPATDEELVRIFGKKSHNNPTQQRKAQQASRGNLYSPKFSLLA